MVCISSHGGGAKAHGDGSGRVIPGGARHRGRPRGAPDRLPLIALLGEDRGSLASTDGPDALGHTIVLLSLLHMWKKINA